MAEAARAVDAEDEVHCINISGATLASILHDVANAEEDGDGLLFGRVTARSVTSISDASDVPVTQGEVIATITGFCFTGKLLSFYDATGAVDPSALKELAHKQGPSNVVIGWFVSQHQAPLRPSMRQVAVSSALRSSQPWPCFFALFTASSCPKKATHTYDYTFHQCHKPPVGFRLVPRSVSIVNIGPGFRGHYDAFAPTAPFPYLGGVPLESPKARGVLSARSVFGGEEEAQALLSRQAEGYGVEDLRALMGGEGASRQIAELEALYGSMLARLEGLARETCEASAAVAQQTQVNRRLRYARRSNDQG